MVIDRQCRNREWEAANETGTIMWDRVPVCVLMDIRRELHCLNHLLSCPNFTGIPLTLQHIQWNTRKPQKRKKRGKR